jgi:acyl-CoA dehydrogenase
VVMVAFSLTAQQKALQEAARKFARNEMMPVAKRYDESMEFPWDVMRKAHANGLLNISMPEKLGGMGLPLLDQVMIGEEMAYGCSGISTAMGANDLALGPLLVAGNEAQLEEFAKPMVAEPQMAAYCVTEPGAGSDVQAIRTTVRRDGDHYILNGEKMWITNAGVATWYYVLATLEPGQGYKAMCAFVIPAKLPGIQAGKKEINLGQRCSDTRAVRFTDVKVHRRYLLGEEGDGFKIAMKAFDKARPATATAAVGLAQCAFDHALRYAQERQTFGKQIAQHQAVAFLLADMAKDVEASRLLVHKAAYLYDQGERNTKVASMAKCFATDAAVRITQDAIQIFGGYGYNTEYPVEKLYRDAKIFQIYEGTNQIQRLIIARHALDENRI